MAQGPARLADQGEGIMRTRTGFVSRLIGAIFIEYHWARRTARPFLVRQSRGGEHLLWIGRLHLIYTPARIVFGRMARTGMA
jgi:hypothetical protein